MKEFLQFILSLTNSLCDECGWKTLLGFPSHFLIISRARTSTKKTQKNDDGKQCYDNGRWWLENIGHREKQFLGDKEEWPGARATKVKVNKCRNVLNFLFDGNLMKISKSSPFLTCCQHDKRKNIKLDTLRERCCLYNSLKPIRFIIIFMVGVSLLACLFFFLHSVDIVDSRIQII